MRNKDLILMLINKSTNAFGELIGLTEEAKLKVALSIIRDTTITALGIDPSLLTPESLADILVKGQLDSDQARLLTNLLWTQAEILLKLKQPNASLTNYENALYLLQWQTRETLEKNHLEKQNKITKLKAVIETMQLDSYTKNGR